MIERLEAALADRYRIERELGEGGMATVYLADDLKHNRKVALKVLKPDLAQMLGKERFLAEIETTANLQHPNILPLFDSGEAGGFLFYVMPYVEGESLQDRLDRDGQFPIADAVRIASEVAEALDHAHRQGVVHRDIKPANILLSDGRPLVADFGIALAVGTAGGTRLTETGLSLGTPYYMSPEQAMGDQPVGVASDQYALGCVLYEMLVGEPPHTGGSAQAVLARIITGSATPPAVQRPSIPPNVDAAIRKALERVPVDRFGTAREFAAALADPGFRYGEIPGEVAGGVSRRAVAGVGLLALVLGGAAGLLAAGAFGIGGGEDGAPAFDPAVRPLQVTFSGEALRPAISPDGEWVAHVDRSECLNETFVTCRVSVVVRGREGGQPLTLAEGLVEVWDLRFSPDGESVAFIGGYDDGREFVFTVSRLGGAIRPVGEALPFDFDPDGTAIWTMATPAGASPVLRRLSYPEGTVESETEVTVEEVLRMRVSPDGDRFVLVEDGQLVLVSRDGSVIEARPTPHREQVAWTPDGDAVVLFETGTVREDDLVRIEVTDDGFGERTLLRGGIPTDYRGDMDVALETGDVLYAQGAGASELYALDLTDPDATAVRYAAGSTWYGRPNPYDASTIFYQRGDAVGDNVYRYDVETGVEVALTEESSAGGAAIGFATDGSRATYARVSTVSEVTIGVIDLPSGRHRLYEQDRYVDLLHPIGPAGIIGRESIAGRVVLRRLDAPDGEFVTIPADLPTGGDASIVDFAVSPDESTLAVVAMQGTLGTLGTLPVDGGEIQPVARFTLDGSAELVVTNVFWVTDGIRVARWLADDDAPSVWAWSDDRQALARLLDVPAPCNLVDGVSLDTSSSLLTCVASDRKTDLFILPGFGR
ncbi:MAG TPA: serine/threonine-protein kinase [Longimicrobiales bacterium]|nr:serine/threonine-protein kinase [Longimicrobiales bacterium]